MRIKTPPHKREEEEDFTAADLPPWWAVLVTAATPVSASLALSQAVCACPMVAYPPWVLEFFCGCFDAWIPLVSVNWGVAIKETSVVVAGGVSVWRVGSSDESGAICQVEDLLMVRCSFLEQCRCLYPELGFASPVLFLQMRPEDTLVATGFSPVKRSDLRCVVLCPAVCGGWTCFGSLVWLSSSQVLVVCPYWRPILVSFGCLLVSLRWF
ncbi:hypothetical protein F2Q69_00039146 [Brassica cretica]|uniref:Transmembrane protein n=1 Tax=Brassica cretica TaxID=69181 RepID=A0A8S9STD4_BRACR|nr:hypothetical protein F2Q69_00039146 [Brassica cretica]